MGETNNKKYQYDLKYRKKHIKRVPLDMRIEDYNRLAEAAKKCNLAVNTFIKQAINEKINTVCSDQPKEKEWYGYAVFQQEQQNQQPKQDQQATLEADDDDYKLPWETD